MQVCDMTCVYACVGWRVHGAFSLLAQGAHRFRAHSASPCPLCRAWRAAGRCRARARPPPPARACHSLKEVVGKGDTFLWQRRHMHFASFAYAHGTSRLLLRVCWADEMTRVWRCG